MSVGPSKAGHEGGNTGSFRLLRMGEGQELGGLQADIWVRRVQRRQQGRQQILPIRVDAHQATIGVAADSRVIGVGQLSKRGDGAKGLFSEQGKSAARQ